jgi:hypothetical protein
MKAKLSLRLVTLLLVGGLMLGAPLTSVSAAVPITGVATSCGGLASCTFFLSDGSGGTGTLTASAGVGGYVGQSPLPFAGGYVSFKLPGEAQVTYASGVYSGEAVLQSGTGSTYQTTGTFYAIDVNTGLVVTGTTVTVITITGHSGRGGGNTYTLNGGSVSITESTPHTTTMTLSCSPTPIAVEAQTSCTATVTDTDTGTPVPPSGPIAFTSDSAGTFSSTSCSPYGTGATASCAVSYTPASGTEGTQTITATYLGDSFHLGSPAASFAITVGKRSTSTYLSCTSPFHRNARTTCTVIVSDISPGYPLQPSGTVKFASNHPGRFSSTTCSLNENGDTMTCSVTFTPTRTGSYTLKATYGGDSEYFGSTTSQTFKVA